MQRFAMDIFIHSKTRLWQKKRSVLISLAAICLLLCLVPREQNIVTKIIQISKAEAKLIKQKERDALLPTIAQNITLRKGDDKDSYVNLHSYKYHISAPPCPPAKSSALIVVHSKFSNFRRRAWIRYTWAHPNLKTLKGISYRVVFMLGEPPGLALQNQTARRTDDKNDTLLIWRAIHIEAEKYNDIVLGNFEDSYRNLTHKHIMGMGWTLSSCPKLSFVIKVDDDVAVNVFHMARYLKSLQKHKQTKRVLLCNVNSGLEIRRDRVYKWYLSMEEYSFSSMPDWCSGFGFIMSLDTVQKLYATSSRVRTLWVDDVYVTGLVALVAGLKPQQLPDAHPNYNCNGVKKMEPAMSYLMVTCPFEGPRNLSAYWDHVLETEGS